MNDITVNKKNKVVKTKQKRGFVKTFKYVVRKISVVIIIATLLLTGTTLLGHFVAPLWLQTVIGYGLVASSIVLFVKEIK